MSFRDGITDRPAAGLGAAAGVRRRGQPLPRGEPPRADTERPGRWQPAAGRRRAHPRRVGRPAHRSRPPGGRRGHPAGRRTGATQTEQRRVPARMTVLAIPKPVRLRVLGTPFTVYARDDAVRAEVARLFAPFRTAEEDAPEPGGPSRTV